MKQGSQSKHIIDLQTLSNNDNAKNNKPIKSATKTVAKKPESSNSVKSLNKPSKKNKWIFWLLGIIGVGLLVGLAWYFINQSLSNNLNIALYYSRGTRDTEKKEQYEFAQNDPIQIKVDFKKMQDGDVLKLSLLKLNAPDEPTLITELPFNNGEGVRFVTLSPLLYKDAGQYKIIITDPTENQSDILVEKMFEIK